MTNDALAMGPYVPRMDDEEETSTALKAPVVDSKADRLNPEVEYEVLDLAGEKPEALKQRLNELGKDGWQLVATTPSFVFRRMKKPDEPKLKTRVGFGIQ